MANLMAWNVSKFDGRPKWVYEGTEQLFLFLLKDIKIVEFAKNDNKWNIGGNNSFASSIFKSNIVKQYEFISLCINIERSLCHYWLRIRNNFSYAS